MPVQNEKLGLIAGKIDGGPGGICLFAVGELGAKLELILKMPEAERLEWSRRAMERVATRYSWDSVTEEYEQLLLKLQI